MKKNTRFFCGNKRFMSFGNQLVMFYRPYSCINRSHFCLVKKKTNIPFIAQNIHFRFTYR